MNSNKNKIGKNSYKLADGHAIVSQFHSLHYLPSEKKKKKNS